MVLYASETTKKTFSRKPLFPFNDLFYVKQKLSVHQFGDANTKNKVIRKGNFLWYIIKNNIGYIKMNASVKHALYYWNIQHPQVLQSPISNYFIRVSVDGHT